jgi:hypothetical protein
MEQINILAQSLLVYNDEQKNPGQRTRIVTERKDLIKIMDILSLVKDGMFHIVCSL